MVQSRLERRRQQSELDAGTMQQHREAATLAAIERAQAALKAADRFLAIAAEQQRLDSEPDSIPRPPSAPEEGTAASKPLRTRKQLRAMGQLGRPESEVEITGIIARGTSATDYLSWDTTSLPVIARPRK